MTLVEPGLIPYVCSVQEASDAVAYTRYVGTDAGILARGAEALAAKHTG